MTGFFIGLPIGIAVGIVVDKKWTAWREAAKAKAKAKLANMHSS